jgi:hypothetical protein
MKLLLFLLACGTAVAAPAPTPDAASEFLRYLYGATDVKIAQVCRPHEDLWMLHGQPNPAGLAQIAEEKISSGRNEIIWRNINQGLCIVEVRDGLVDPTCNLDQVYFQHRKLVWQFIYSALQQDTEQLGELTTNARNIKFGGARAARGGDMDVYQEIVAMLPVLRVPGSNAAARTVSYRVPLAPKGFTVRLVKTADRGWKVDAGSVVDVPLREFFK